MTPRRVSRTDERRTSVRAAERFLRHDNTDHDEFAATMTACEGYAPACSDAGECLRGGDCFAPDPKWRAVRRIERMARDEEHPGIRAGIKRAATLLAAELRGDEEDGEISTTGLVR